MKAKFITTAFIIVGFLLSLVMGTGALAVQTKDPKLTYKKEDAQKRKEALKRFEKKRSNKLDVPNEKERQKLLKNHKKLAAKIKQMRKQKLAKGLLTLTEEAEAEVITDRVLVILVEFGGTDVLSWDPATSAWDPLGRPDSAEDTGADYGTPAACSNIITEPQTFTYSGPLHNQIPVPETAAGDFDGENLVSDFNQQYYHDLIFGDGVTLSYTRGDGTSLEADFTGMSVADYYWDISGGTYRVIGEVVGWVQVDHSTWYYGGDVCPGARSVGRSSFADGAIEGAGSTKNLVVDALEAVKAANPDFNWAQYDMDGDGVIDRLWIIHAGVGEEEGVEMLAQTEYGEAAIWSHSSSLGAPYEIVPGVSANAYIIMPENSGIAVLAHEYGHNLGADDLYAYGDGETSTGFWSLMSDSWTGFPIGFQPGSVDPWHLDGWGWLNPETIVDPNGVYNVTLGQASNFPGGENTFRAAKIALEDGQSPFASQPIGNHQWWGNEQNVANSMMTLVNPVTVQGTNPTLSMALAYDIEAEWDYMWIQASADNGTTWDTLTNANTVCEHDVDWIGSAYGFPDDLCGAGIGGFSGHNPHFPDHETETFDLSAYAGQSIIVRIWYMTDWGSLEKGPFVDEIRIANDTETLFYDGAENGDGNWTYADNWMNITGSKVFTHNFYLQWRNTGTDGGYDSALGDSRHRYGPADTGLLVWYNNNLYPDNELADYMNDFPSYGPKGRMLIVDAHPEPYRDPYFLNLGYNNEAANLHDLLNNSRYNRGSMRDAAFSLVNGSDYPVHWPYVQSDMTFPGRPAVSLFDDSLGYYAGAELTNGAPTSSNYFWMTREWDGSTVVPSRTAYPLNAPEYTAGNFMIFGITVDQTGGTDSWDYAGFNILDYDGGNGNPAQTGGEYGWKVKILSQTNQKARIAIWNGKESAPYTVEIIKAGNGDGSVTELVNNLLDCGEFCTAMAKEGTAITLSASGDENSIFAGWTGSDCSGTGTCSLTVNGDISVVANFVRSNYKIEVGFEEGCSVTFIPNSSGELTAKSSKTTTACHVTGDGDLDFDGKKVEWELDNVGTGGVTINHLFVQWPAENGQLKQIKLGGKSFHNDHHAPTSAVIDSNWKGPEWFRQIDADGSEELEFKFMNQAVE